MLVSSPRVLSSLGLFPLDIERQIFPTHTHNRETFCKVFFFFFCQLHTADALSVASSAAQPSSFLRCEEAIFSAGCETELLIEWMQKYKWQNYRLSGLPSVCWLMTLAHTRTPNLKKKNLIFVPTFSAGGGGSRVPRSRVHLKTSRSELCATANWEFE